MNHDIKQFWVVPADAALLTSGTTINLTAGKVGIFNSSSAAISTAPTGVQSPYIFLAQGNGVPTLNSFKTDKIYIRNITDWYGDTADNTGLEQITYVGWDEINDCKTPDISCDKDYYITLRVFEHYLNNVQSPFLQETVLVKSPCCADCGTDCDDLGAFAIFTQFAAKINESSRFTSYVTASVVSKLVSGTAVAPTFCLTLPDPGTSLGNILTIDHTTAAAGLTNGTNTAVASTSAGAGTGATFTVLVAGNVVTSVTTVNDGTGYEVGEVITIAGTALTGGTTPADDIVVTVTGTDGAEGNLLQAVRTYYVGQVANAEADIIYSADIDSSDSDANSTGNVMIVLTPSAGITLANMENYEGVAWEECACANLGTAVYEVGLKLVGVTPVGFTSACIPDAAPYLANKTRFKVYAGEAPIGSQYEDMPDFCNEWFVTTTQEVKYPVGAGYAIAEIERWFKGNDIAGAGARHYWQSQYNDDIPYFANSSLTYDIYYLKYLASTAGAGFEHATNYPMEIAIAVPSTMTAWKTAFETVMNAYVAYSPSYQGPVVL